MNPPQAGKTAGGVLLEDGSVAPVLNPAELWEAFRVLGASAGPRAASHVQKKKPATILVVDDSITTRSLEKSILEAHGYRVRVAVDGMDGLAQLRTAKPDLVIADILMPRLDGFGLLDEMKKDRELAGIPVIIVSTEGKDEDTVRGLQAGAVAYVRKPFRNEAVADLIRQVVERYAPAAGSTGGAPLGTPPGRALTLR